ncbi:MAG: NADPH-dependent FMN reductase [Pseudomonadota bacterium]
MTINVVTISGSLRKGSFNSALQRALPALAPAGMTLTEAPAYDGFPLYNADVQNSAGFPDAVKAFGSALSAADGIIITTPEYNYSVPGALKNAIDWVSRLENQPFKDKPVAIQSATGGPLGGARMQYHLRSILVFLNALTFNTPEIFVGSVHTKFNEQFELTDEPTRKIVGQQLEAFGKFIARVRA